MQRRDRYYVRTGRYHYWQVMRRDDANMDASVVPNSDLDDVIDTYGARGRGDAAARELARKAADRLNANCQPQPEEQELSIHAL